MTREEMKELKGLAASMGLYDDRNPCKRAVILGKAIEALEQDTVPFDFELYEAGMMSMPKEMIEVLDKIRAEIVELQKDYHEYGWAYDDALEIIDKYRAESEGE